MSKRELKQKIKEAVEKDPLKDNIQRVSLFGSYVHGDFKEDSDVDVLIEFTPTAKVGFFKYFDIRENIEKHLQKKVDLLTPEALSKYFKDEVLKEAEIIYEKR
ncbi:MAG: nucleotidyltransferase [Candidatus Moranbacteria bacterium CG_4_9_14_3_um_filter_40_7]|nr:MAG: nucleotidyltransferase [Candidatus Moranbacteria bacterium CG06_land_8_20_14_3_00_40_12]PJA87990.1 MAG: nucleotidyltransferase [Candidatus Moranbacteria bacterium CG_4_9_14_3_um_filter_40_7]